MASTSPTQWGIKAMFGVVWHDATGVSCSHFLATMFFKTHKASKLRMGYLMYFMSENKTWKSLNHKTYFRYFTKKKKKKIQITTLLLVLFCLCTAPYTYYTRMDCVKTLNINLSSIYAVAFLFIHKELLILVLNTLPILRGGWYKWACGTKPCLSFTVKTRKLLN